MIVIYHINNKVAEVTGSTANASHVGRPVAKCLPELCRLHPDAVVVWCHALLKPDLDLEAVAQLFHHRKLLFSYHTSGGSFLNDCIGYVESSTSIKISKTVKFATWQMSSDVGAVHASVLLACISDLNTNDHFDYFLNSFAKRAMPLGLFCYSEPRLLKSIHAGNLKNKASLFQTFRFVKQHYKWRWIFLLMLNLAVYEGRFPVFVFLASLFYGRRDFKTSKLDAVNIESSREIIQTGTIDVIIPTIGRKEHLHNVLKDLAMQTHLPVNVIIVEQNPLEGSVSELDFLTSETWPFAINHIFTHQTGACRARNLCLSLTKSEFVFLADDDNRFDADLIEKVFLNFKKLGNEVLLMAYPQQGEIIKPTAAVQYHFFGGGNAFLKRKCLDHAAFDTAYEFGYGEDNDFGMQLRFSGHDVLYLPYVSILHLKAPMGGFRTKAIFKWSDEKIQPKPSPTVMLYQLKYFTREQHAGYKTNLFIKFYSSQPEKNPFRYFRKFKEQWNKSVFWATALANKA